MLCHSGSKCEGINSHYKNKTALAKERFAKEAHSQMKYHAHKHTKGFISLKKHQGNCLLGAPPHWLSQFCSHYCTWLFSDVFTDSTCLCFRLLVSSESRN